MTFWGMSCGDQTQGSSAWKVKQWTYAMNHLSSPCVHILKKHGKHFSVQSMGSPEHLFKSLDFVLLCVVNLDFVVTSIFQTTASLCSGLSLQAQIFPLFFSAMCSVFSQILTSYTVPWFSIIRSLTMNITHEHQPLVTISKHLSSYFLCIEHLGILFFMKHNITL